MFKSVDYPKHSVHLSKGIWYIYSHYPYGYFVPGYLHTVTRSKKELKAFVRKWCK